MHCILYLILLILCIVWRSQTVLISRIPEGGGISREGNFTELCGIPCVHLKNPPNPDAEFFIAMTNRDVQNALNRQSEVPIRIIASLEPSHYIFKSLFTLEYLNTYFHGSAILDWNSDIPWVMMPNMDEVKKVQLPKDPIPKISFVARNCWSSNGREAYVKVIDSFIGVVALSICFHNTEWPKCGENDCSKIEALRKYKINLAFENGDSHHYVTEKIYEALEAGVLPVYMGTQTVVEAVPKGSYIHVADFDSPKSLALYLAKVLADDALYQSYFEWKQKPFEEKFEVLFRVLWSESVSCRVCRYVDAYKNNLQWDQRRQRATTNQARNRRVVLTKDNSTLFSQELLGIGLCFMLFLFVIYFRKRTYKLFHKLTK